MLRVLHARVDLLRATRDSTKDSAVVEGRERGGKDLEPQRAAELMSTIGRQVQPIGT